uniref:RxLR effector protein n=1 Tax=Chromera velia CCMP2878 TaxID=1169474 RepID=A0A0G4HU30_9ALVE|eukprot:Cvel_8559.t1-p1 / transcript=Cvel_8559.t1 / gene=Cvel_8559 / organism=Chromera_velia_CCMP2878 / gene_product=hypothetical protein / transcript_product=hypothetical protein / location=Cvel_scaffold475:930-1868(-) / protein_length=185 / sequence_SO=supercontig / SO=protein_coding / is_pseudo=false
MRGARAPSLCALLLLLLFLSFLPGPADGLRQQPVPQGAHHANTFRGQVENAYRHFFSWLRGGRGGAGSGALQPPRLRTSPEREGVGVHGQSAGAEETDNDTEPNDAMLERGRGAEKHGGIFGFLQIWGPSKEHKLNFNRLIAAVSDKMDDVSHSVGCLLGSCGSIRIFRSIKGKTKRAARLEWSF